MQAIQTPDSQQRSFLSGARQVIDKIPIVPLPLGKKFDTIQYGSAKEAAKARKFTILSQYARPPSQHRYTAHAYFNTFKAISFFDRLFGKGNREYIEWTRDQLPWLDATRFIQNATGQSVIRLSYGDHRRNRGVFGEQLIDLSKHLKYANKRLPRDPNNLEANNQLRADILRKDAVDLLIATVQAAVAGAPADTAAAAQNYLNGLLGQINVANSQGGRALTHVNGQPGYLMSTRTIRQLINVYVALSPINARVIRAVRKIYHKSATVGGYINMGANTNNQRHMYNQERNIVAGDAGRATVLSKIYMDFTTLFKSNQALGFQIFQSMQAKQVQNRLKSETDRVNKGDVKSNRTQHDTVTDAISDDGASHVLGHITYFVGSFKANISAGGASTRGWDKAQARAYDQQLKQLDDQLVAAADAVVNSQSNVAKIALMEAVTKASDDLFVYLEQNATRDPNGRAPAGERALVRDTSARFNQGVVENFITANAIRSYTNVVNKPNNTQDFSIVV